MKMLAGPFKKWRHLHRFSNIHEKQTEIKDEIEFELPYGLLGKLFGGYAYKQLQNIFEYRKIVTIRALKVSEVYSYTHIWFGSVLI